MQAIFICLLPLLLSLALSVIVSDWGSSEHPHLHRVLDDNNHKDPPCSQTAILGMQGNEFGASRSPSTVYRWGEQELHNRERSWTLKMKGTVCELVLLSICQWKNHYHQSMGEWVGKHIGDWKLKRHPRYGGRSPNLNTVFLVIPCLGMGKASTWNLLTHDGKPLVFDYEMHWLYHMPLIAVLLLQPLSSVKNIRKDSATGPLLLLQSQPYPLTTPYGKVSEFLQSPAVRIPIHEELDDISALLSSNPRVCQSIRWAFDDVNMDGKAYRASQLWFSRWMRDILQGKVNQSRQLQEGLEWSSGIPYAEILTHGEHLQWRILHTRIPGYPRLETSVLAPEGFNFLSCSTAPSSLQYEMYHKPFMADLWIGLGLAIIVLTTTIVLWERFILGTDGVDFGRVVLLLISSLVEDCSPTQTAAKSKTAFRMAFGTWVLLSTVLSTGYIGTVINFVNLPPPRRPYNRWESLPCLYNKSVDVDSLSTWKGRITELGHNVGQSRSDFIRAVQRRTKEDPHQECMEVYTGPEESATNQGFTYIAGNYFVEHEYNELLCRIKSSLRSIPKAQNGFKLFPTWERYILYGLSRLFLGVNPIPRYRLADPSNTKHYAELVGRVFSKSKEQHVMEQSLAECKYSAFAYFRLAVTRKDDVLEHFQKAYPKVQWYRNVDEELLLARFTYIIFLPPHNSPIPTYFKWMQATGAFAKGVADTLTEAGVQMKQMSLVTKSRKTDAADGTVRRLSLHNSSVATTLVLAFSSFGICSIIFCVEKIWRFTRPFNSSRSSPGENITRTTFIVVGNREVEPSYQNGVSGGKAKDLDIHELID